MKPFANEPILELRRAPIRAQLRGRAGGLRRRAGDPGAGVGRRGHARRRRADLGRSRAIPSGSWRSRRSPPRPTSTTRSTSPRAASGGARRSTARAEVLVRAAAWLRSRRLEIAALEVRETAKPWREADADVCEAIDFLEYYAREAVELAERPGELIQLPGERNELRWAPRGVVAVISPWNFPVAIPLGMVSAGAGHRQRRRAQARRAGARVRVHARARAARVRAAGFRAGAAARRRAGRRGAGRRPARAHDRVHRLRAGRAGDRAPRRRARARASGT